MGGEGAPIPGGGRWWCWRRGRGRVRVDGAGGCPEGGRSMRGNGRLGALGRRGRRATSGMAPPALCIFPGAPARPGSSSSAAPEQSAPEEHRAPSLGGGGSGSSGGVSGGGLRPGRGEGLPGYAAPALCPPSPAAAVRGAERGPERRGPATPPGMRIPRVGKLRGR